MYLRHCGKHADHLEKQHISNQVFAEVTATAMVLKKRKVKGEKESESAFIARRSQFARDRLRELSYVAGLLCELTRSRADSGHFFVVGLCFQTHSDCRCHRACCAAVCASTNARS